MKNEDCNSEKVMQLGDVPVEGIFSLLASRRLMVGTGVGALLGILGANLGVTPETVLPVANAAPTDVAGSPNIAVKSFKNKDGTFILYSDGSIANQAGVKVATDPRSYSNAPGYTKASLVAGKPAGSPHVAIDVVQDKTGTHVLFADGSVRTPGSSGAATPPFASVQYYSYFWDSPAYGNKGLFAPSMTRSGDRFTFETPFAETPIFLNFVGGGGTWAIWLTGHPDAPRIDTRGFTAQLSSTDNQAGIIIGKV